MLTLLFLVVQEQGYGGSLPPKCRVGDCDLILNGTAVRTVLGFKVYAVGLYLGEKQTDGKHIMRQDRGVKRVHLTMLREVKGEKFESTIRKNIAENFSDEERRLFAPQVKTFLGFFQNGSVLKKGDVITIDLLPEKGTQVAVNGRLRDPIPGYEFYHTLLRLWIGNPLQESIKNGLLGAPDSDRSPVP